MFDIELHALSKSFPSPLGRKHIFKNLNCLLPSSVNVGLIGRNGAGKSTLMKLLSGTVQPDSGRIDTPARISFPVGLSGGFLSNLSARDNVAFVARVYGFHGAALRRISSDVQEFAEIGDHFKLPIRTLSSGMRSRVAFGMSMAFDFDIFLIDEVMAVGDAQFKAKCQAVLKERLKNARMILTSHAMNQIRQYCDAVAYVDGGQVTVFSNVEEGIRAYQGTLAEQ